MVVQDPVLDELRAKLGPPAGQADPELEALRARLGPPAAEPQPYGSYGVPGRAVLEAGEQAPEGLPFLPESAGAVGKALGRSVLKGTSNALQGMHMGVTGALGTARRSPMFEPDAALSMLGLEGEPGSQIEQAIEMVGEGAFPLLMGAASGGAAVPVMAGEFGAQAAAADYYEQTARGVDHETAIKSALGAGAVAAGGTVALSPKVLGPLAKALGPVDKATQGGVGRSFTRAALEGGASMAGIGAAQTALTAEVHKYLDVATPEERQSFLANLSDAVQQGGIPSFLAGALMAGTAKAIQAGRQGAQEPRTQEQGLAERPGDAAQPDAAVKPVEAPASLPAAASQEPAPTLGEGLFGKEGWQKIQDAQAKWQKLPKYEMTARELDVAAETNIRQENEAMARVFPELTEQARNRKKRSDALEDEMRARGFDENSPEYAALFYSEDPIELRQLAGKLRDIETETTPEGIASKIPHKILPATSAKEKMARGEKPTEAESEALALLTAAGRTAREAGVDPQAMQKAIVGELGRRGYRAEDFDLFEPFFVGRKEQARSGTPALSAAPRMLGPARQPEGPAGAPAKVVTPDTATEASPVPIKPETKFERFDREMGDVMSAWERVTRDQLEGKGAEARKEPTYLGVEGKESSDPAFRALRQAQVESQAHRSRSKTFYEPTNKQLAKAGITSEEFGEILYARTAPERNVRMEKINPGQTALSGMETTEAQATLAKWQADPRWPEIERALALQDQMLKTNLERGVREGLIPHEEVESYTDQFYAPLRTSKPGEAVGGGRAGIRGREFQPALGRTSRADNPYVWSQVQDMRMTARIESNRTKRAAANLVREMNDGEFAQVVPQEEFVKRGLVAGEGEQVVGEVRDLDFLDRPDAVAFKEGGKQYAIVFGEDYVPFATALRGSETVTPGGIKNKVLGGALRGMNAYSRAFKRVVSKDNPFFWPVNLIAYDTPSTFLRQWSERGIKFAVHEQFNAVRLLPDLLGNGPVMQRYRAVGGEIPNFGVADFDTLQARIDAQVKAGDTASAMRSFVEKYEAVGSAFENLHRLSVFDLATRPKEKGGLGMSDDRGALAGAEANINFARKGQLGPTIEAFQPYYQAGANNLRALSKVARGKNVKQVAAAATAFGFMLDQLNRTIAGTDENGENEYDKLEQWEKDGNFVLMQPGGKGKALMVPKPPGLAWLFNVGMYASEAALGPTTAGGASAKTAANLLHNLSPVNVAPSPAGGVTQVFPPAVRPVAEAMVNKDRYGNEIVRENIPGRPAEEPHERHRKNVSPPIKGVTDKLAEATDVSVSPSLVEHLLKGYLPGLLTEAGRIVNVAAKGEADVRDIPLVRRFAREGNPYFTDHKFYENRQAIVDVKARYDELRKEGKTEEALALRREHAQFFRQIGRLQMTERMLEKFPDTPEGEDRKRRLRARFNKAVKAGLQ